MSVTPSGAFACLLTLSFKTSFRFSNFGGGGRVECNEELKDKRQQVAVLWQPIVKNPHQQHPSNTYLHSSPSLEGIPVICLTASANQTLIVFIVSTAWFSTTNS